MRARERLRQGRRVLQRLGERQRPAGQPGAERLAVEVLHDEELEAVLLPDVVERADVRMVEPRDGAGLALEALAPIGLRRRVRRQDLDRDRAADAGVDRAVDVAHAPTAEQDADFVRPQSGAGL